jgi:hypothetical protein
VELRVTVMRTQFVVLHVKPHIAVSARKDGRVMARHVEVRVIAATNNFNVKGN